MRCFLRIQKNKSDRGVGIVLAGAVLFIAFMLPAATADSPIDAKRIAFEAIDRNADQIATVGDVLTLANRECRSTRAQNT